MKNETRAGRIRTFVETVHEGQTYGGGRPYTYHLDAVKAMLAAAGLDGESDGIIADCHDVIEDAKPEERDNVIVFVRNNTTGFEFRVIWALTGIGENRKARNADAKAKITADPVSANYKLADRLVNWENSEPGSNHEAMYRKEDPEFYEAVVTLATNEYLVKRYLRLSGR